jgi:hypothetical protein
MAVKAGFIILATQETEAGELDVQSSQTNLARPCNIFKKDRGNLDQGERLCAYSLVLEHLSGLCQSPGR